MRDTFSKEALLKALKPDNDLAFKVRISYRNLHGTTVMCQSHRAKLLRQFVKNENVPSFTVERVSQ